MGAFQSCLNAKCRNLMGGSSNGGGGNNALEAGDGGEPKKKEYSWDKKRREVDLSKFTIENVAAGEVGRMPGEINGEQMIIRNCENCSIYLFDHINTATIDDCKSCRIFVGPTQGSIFVRDCSDCVVVAACGQFRTRDCKKVDFFLCCATQPIVEATTGARFACFQYHYPSLASQFTSAGGLSPFNNLWWNVHDFTPVQGERNWTLLGECYKVHDFLPAPEGEKFKSLQLSTKREHSLVPLTLGSRRRDHDETSLVILFFDSESAQADRAARVVAKMDEYAEIDLIKTRRLVVESADSERIFESKEFRAICERGPIIALQFGGPDCVRVCLDLSKILNSEAANVGGGGVSAERLVYSSRDAASGQRDIHNLFNFADMQLGI